MWGNRTKTQILAQIDSEQQIANIVLIHNHVAIHTHSNKPYKINILKFILDVTHTLSTGRISHITLRKQVFNNKKKCPFNCHKNKRIQNLFLNNTHSLFIHLSKEYNLNKFLREAVGPLQRYFILISNLLEWFIELNQRLLASLRW